MTPATPRLPKPPVRRHGPSKCLGRIQPRSDPRTLMLRAFAPAMANPPPTFTHFWTRRANFSNESWGNRAVGDCTLASQCNLFRLFERLERGRTVVINPQEVIDKYFQMTQDLYGGGDTGAYEEDALNRSRSEDTCMRDASGHPLLIDAYVRVDPKDIDAVKWALAMSAGHGIKICFNLPLAWSGIDPPAMWDVPEGQPLTGEWEPGSWGGHSMTAQEYNSTGLLLPSTWEQPPQWVTWRGVAAFADECHVVIDRKDDWLKRPIVKRGGLDLAGIVKAVNKVSRTKIKT
jgi:hypothetical protein